MTEEKYHANLFGLDLTKTYQEMEKNHKHEQERRTKLGLCYLCGGNHLKDVPRSVELTCPSCKQHGTYNLMPNCPGGVSHGETHKCPKCGVENFIVIYYDGEIIMDRTLNPQIP